MEIEEAKRRARAAPLVLLLKRFMAIMITLVSTVTVARLLSPREYGLANMAAVLLAFAQLFRDFGMTNAVLRKGSISQEELNFLFWFNAGMTMMLTLLIALLSPLASNFYHEPVVMWVMLVSALGFAANGVALQHRVIISRDLRFGTLTRIDITSSLIGFVVTLALAYVRRDVWAIVIGNLCLALSAASQAFLSSGWRPNRPKRFAEWRPLFAFAANSSVYTVSIFLSENSGPILIGHFLGSSLLGQFNRANALYQLPNANLVSPITQALMPLLMRLRQHTDEYRLAYLGLLRRLCIVLVPLAITLVFAGEPLAVALLGARWAVAGRALEALAPALIGIGFAASAGDLFITQDRSAALRGLGIFELVCRVGAVAACVPFGVVPAAAGFSVSAIIVAVVRIVVAGQSGPITTADQIRAISPSFLPAIAAGVVSALARWFPLPNALAHAVLIIGAGAMATLLVSVSLRPSREAITELAQTFGLIRVFKRFMRSSPMPFEDFK